jgi:hypothetical protein
MKMTVELPQASRGEIRAAGEILRKLSREFSGAPTVKLAIGRGIAALLAWHRALPGDAAGDAAGTEAGPPVRGAAPTAAAARGLFARLPYDKAADVAAQGDEVECRFCHSACEKIETPSCSAWRCTAAGCVGHGQWVARGVIEAPRATLPHLETEGLTEG